MLAIYCVLLYMLFIVAIICYLGWESLAAPATPLKRVCHWYPLSDWQAPHIYRTHWHEGDLGKVPSSFLTSPSPLSPHFKLWVAIVLLLFQVLYHHILSCDRQALTTRGYPLIIDTKTFQRLCLIIPRESDCINIIETVTSFAQPGQTRYSVERY